MIKRYNIELRCWEIGYWITNTTFKVVAFSKS